MADVCPETGNEVALEQIDEDYGSLGDGGSYVRLRCPDCGKEFWHPLPD